MVTTRQTGNIAPNSFEFQAWSQQFLVIGIDEVGRGCFAGPVVAAAVILPTNTNNPLLRDSKKMTAKEREMAFAWIQDNCQYATGIVHHRAIDEYNIRQATFMAMKKALFHLMAVSTTRPAAILIDAMPLDLSYTYLGDIPVYHFTQGESRSSSVAAASIVAKITRDAMMKLYDRAIPGYKLSDNKGYGTAKHRTAITNNQPSLIHRMSFLQKLLGQDYSKREVQLSLSCASHSQV